MSDKVLIDRELLKELVSSLEGEVESRYSNGIKDHPAMRRDYECDIEPVIRGKELLAAAPAAPVVQAEQQPVAWQVRMVGDTDWQSCGRQRYERIAREGWTHVEIRALCVIPPRPPAHPDAALVDELERRFASYPRGSVHQLRLRDCIEEVKSVRAALAGKGGE